MVLILSGRVILEKKAVTLLNGKGSPIPLLPVNPCMNGNTRVMLNPSKNAAPIPANTNTSINRYLDKTTFNNIRIYLPLYLFQGPMQVIYLGTDIDRVVPHKKPPVMNNIGIYPSPDRIIKVFDRIVS